MLLSGAAAAAERWQDLYEPEVFEGMPVRVMKPLGFDSKKTYPLIVSLHGAGGKGTNNDKQLKDWNRQLAEQQRRKDFPCYVVAPQAAELWNAEHLGKNQVAHQGALPAVDIASHLHHWGIRWADMEPIFSSSWIPGYFAAAAPSAGSGLKTNGRFYRTGKDQGPADLGISRRQRWSLPN